MIQEIFEKVDFSPSDIVKKKFGNSPQITGQELVEAILNTRSGKEVCTLFSFSEKTYKNLMKRLFPQVTLSGGKEDWRYYLTSLTSFKWCNSCNSFVHRSKFSKKNANKDGLSSQCKECYKSYYEDNRGTIIASANNRREVVIRATPKWADLSKIAIIYSDCHKGYEVDHIIPLQGKNVCGLHVENNLQYLTLQENRKKSNKHD